MGKIATKEIRDWSCHVNASKESLEFHRIDVQKAVEQFDWIAAQFGYALSYRQLLVREYSSCRRRERIKEDIVLICSNAYYRPLHTPGWIERYACNLPCFDHMWFHDKCFVTSPYSKYPESMFTPTAEYHGGKHHPDIVVAELGVKFWDSYTYPYIVFFEQDMPHTAPPFGWKFL